MSSALTLLSRLLDEEHLHRFELAQATAPLLWADRKQRSFETVEWKVLSAGGDHLPSRQNRPSPAQVSRFGFDQVNDAGTSLSTVTGARTIAVGRGQVIQQPVRDWYLVCGKQDAGGDGTVAVGSGSAPMRQGGVNIRQQFRLTGFDHEGSFGKPGPQHVTLYALMKIAAHAKVSV